MTPEQTAQHERISRLVARVEEHQTALRMADSNSRFVARYQKRLGSVDTWRRLRERDWAGLGSRLEKWEQRLNALVTDLAGATDLPDFWPDMPMAHYGLQAFDALQGQRSDRRVAWLVGPTGVGKSWTMRWIEKNNRAGTAYVHANRAWRDSLLQISRGFAAKVGAAECAGGAATYQNVVEALKANPLTLLVDDLHEGGALILKLVKHLVDDTRAKFILATYPTAWAALLNGSSDAQSEAQQLLGRSIKPLREDWKKGLTPGDIAMYVRKTCDIPAGAALELGNRLAPLARRHGNLRLLADAIDDARDHADSTGKDLDAETIEAAVSGLCPAPEKA